MKKFVSILFCVLFSAGAFAQEGVNFQQLTYKEALAKAKAENKLVFVDGYTSWCGPCKYMATEIFTQPEAGNFFNPRFVCVKFDMEKGEGKELAEKWNVQAFPSFFIIRPDGIVQHKLVGGGELKPFISRVEKGLDKKTSLYSLQQAYAKGKMGKKQLLDYKIALSEASESEESAKVQQQLAGMLTEKDKLKKEFWPLFEDQGCKVGTDNFNFVLAHLPVFEKNLGKEKLEEYLYNSYMRALFACIDEGEGQGKLPVQELKKQIDRLDIPKKADLLDKYTVAEAVSLKDAGKLLALFEPKAATLTEEELLTYVGAFNTIYEQAGKEECARVAAVCEKAMKKSEAPELKNYFEGLVDFYRTKAHVGVYFQDLTFKQALEKAENQNKMLFIDGYTSWCGPCKYMANTIFPMEKVGDFMNEQFICVKYDMEKGEGPELAEKFDIRAYPTFVILNPDGTVRHTLVGGGEADEFIERVKEAFDDNKATGVLDAEYQEGNRDKAFMVKYLKGLVQQYSAKAPKVAAELYGSLSDEEKVSEKYWFIFRNAELSPKDSDPDRYLLTNRDKFNQSLGKAKVDSCLVMRCEQDFQGVFYGDTTITVQQLDRLRTKIIGLKLNQAPRLLVNLDVAKAIVNRNPAQILTICEKASAQLPSEEIPYILAGYSMQKLTPAQQERWTRLGKKLIAKAKDPEYAAYLQEYLEAMQAKQGKS